MKKVFFTVVCMSVANVWATDFDWAPAQLMFEMRPAVDVCQPKSFVLTANEQRFYELELSGQDVENIHNLVKKLAKTSYKRFMLDGKKRREVEALGEKIKARVHPLRFMACILTNQERRGYLYDVREDGMLGVYPKWSRFKDGLFDRLEYMRSRNRLGQYIPGFAQELGLNADLLVDFANRKKWNEFLEYIMP